jgi:hypothetical protein
MVSHYLDNRLKDGGKVVSLTRLPRFTPQENYLINSRYSFLLEAESTPGCTCNNIYILYFAAVFPFIGQCFTMQRSYMLFVNVSKEPKRDVK